MPQGYEFCTQVTPECPLEATTYGYRPVLSANVLFVVIFGACSIAQIILGIRYRIRGYVISTAILVDLPNADSSSSIAIATAFGSALEAVGYGGRLMLNANPWDSNGFKIQVTKGDRKYETLANLPSIAVGHLHRHCSVLPCCWLIPDTQALGHRARPREVEITSKAVPLHFCVLRFWIHCAPGGGRRNICFQQP
jgi:hypothetical protein